MNSHPKAEPHRADNGSIAGVRHANADDSFPAWPTENGPCRPVRALT